jgi:glycerol-3-phosphate acyltransferase PlsY
MMIQRLICLALGYVFGLFQTGYLVGLVKHRDIRNYGSGNSGTTNALRVFGKKAGVIVFCGDILKSFLACSLVRYVAGRTGMGEQTITLMLYTGLGVVLGHNYPFYLQFKGGKGIAASWGISLAIDWRIALVCMVIFAAIALTTRYVSLASLCALTSFVVMWFILAARGMLPLEGCRPEADGLVMVIILFGFIRHRSNLKRLLNGTENKLGQRVKLDGENQTEHH